MGTATLLSSIQAVCQELALPVPTAVVNSTDNQVTQMLSLANREGIEAAAMAGKDMGWQEIRKTATITLVNGTASYSLASDCQYLIPGTVWDVNKRWQLLGPLSPQEWDVLQYGISPAGPRRRFRIMGNLLYVNPTPGSADDGNTIAYEYYSNQWCQSNTSTAQSAWAADTDTYLLDDNSLRLGVKWRFLRAKGLDYDEEYKQWFSAINRAIGRSGANRYLPINSLAPGSTQLLSDANVPDTGFGQS